MYSYSLLYYIDKREELQEEYPRPPILLSRHLQFVVKPNVIARLQYFLLNLAKITFSDHYLSMQSQSIM